MEASSLYTHLILPEPTASVAGGRAGGSQRLLAVTADGTLLPGRAVHGPTMQQQQQAVIMEGSREGNAFDSGSSWSWVGSGDNNIQNAASQPSTAVGSFEIAGRDADATVLQLPAGNNSAMWALLELQ
jgi:hypothetical protein